MNEATDRIPVFVNDRAVWIAPGSDAKAAVNALDPGLGEQVQAGLAHLTDGRGIRLVPEEKVYPGAILRVVVSARRAAEAADADA